MMNFFPGRYAGIPFAFLGMAMLLSSAEAVENSDMVTIDHKTVFASLNASDHDKLLITNFLAALPPDHKVEAEWTTVAPDGTKAIRYVSRLTALNAAGKPDGKELNYPDWYHGPSREAEYQNSVQCGIEKRYDTEKVLQSETPWENGKIQGIKRTFHANGKLANETTYEKGVMKGQSRSFSPEGGLIRVVNFEKGEREGESTDYWVDKPDAVERMVPYHKGQVHGLAKGFYLNGKLKWERSFKNNRQHGIEKQYSVDGKLEKTLYWLDGKTVSEEEFRKKFKE